MEYTIKIGLTDDYFIECFEQITHKKRYLKMFELLLAIIFIFFGIFFYIRDPNDLFLPIIFLGLGIFDIFKHQYAKRKWLSRQLKINKGCNEILIIFNESGYKLNTDTFKITQEWNSIDSVEQTPKGIIVRPRVGQVIYLPKKSLDNGTYNKLMQRIT
jgi:hypothetical protein